MKSKRLSKKSGLAKKKNKKLELTEFKEEIIEKLPFGIYNVNEKGIVDYVNPAMLKISDASYEKFIGLNMLKLRTYKKIGLSKNILAGLKGKRFKLGPIDYISHIGKRHSIRIFIGIPLKKKGARGLLVVVEDITERKKKEKELEMLSSVVQQSTEGMAIADLKGNLLFVNKEWAIMHGYRDSKKLIGKSLPIFHTKEQLKKDVLQFNKKVQKQGTNSGEVGHVTKDGKIFPTFMTTTLLKDRQGKPFAIAGIAKDISEQKRIEEKLETKLKELETFKKFAVGRELKMIQLKKRIKELENQ